MKNTLYIAARLLASGKCLGIASECKVVESTVACDDHDYSVKQKYQLKSLR